MTNTTLPDEVLKSDVLGRVRTPRMRREALVEEFEKSGVSAKKFAALVGVNYQTFASWVQARRKARGHYPPMAGKAAGPVRLWEAVVEGAEAKLGSRRVLRDCGLTCRAGAGCRWPLPSSCRWRRSWWP